MIIKQYMELRTTAKLGETGFKTEYKASDLEGDYNIKFRFFSESKEEKIANLSVAAAAERFISKDTIRRNTLKVQDPEAEAERVSAEEAERVDEALFLYNRCSRFIAQGKQIQAWICYRRLEQVLMARMGQGVTAPEEEPSKKIKQPPSTPLIPLVGGGGGTPTTPGVGTEQEEMARAEEEAAATERTSEKGAEASLVAFYQKKADSGEGVDSSTLEALFTGEDSGAGAEAITLLAAMVSHDTGVGIEAVIEFFRKLIDSGQGEENLHLIGYVGRAMKLITYLRAYSDLVVYTKPCSDLRVYTSEVKQ